MRLTLTEPSKPIRWLPKGSVAAPWNSNGMVTDLVMSLMVRSPVTVATSPSTSKEVPTKVIFGNCSTSKKSGLFRWPSRPSLRVLTLAASMTTRRLDAAGLAPSMVAVPSNDSKVPRTLVTIACRATKPTWLCAGSRM